MEPNVKNIVKTEFQKSLFLKDKLKSGKIVKPSSHLNMATSLIIDNSYGSKLCSDISTVNYNKYNKL